MINYFLKLKTENITQKEPSYNDLKQAKKCLFALFTRYGDTIIDLVVIKEFMDAYPEKEYAVLCPRQMLPYVKRLLPESTKVMAVNKRNLFDMLKVHRFLKRENFDIGFNPWSNGVESCYFLTYCSRYLCYSKYTKKHPVNHYEVVRNYMKLPDRTWHIEPLQTKKQYDHVLICPQSTDEQRSLHGERLDVLIEKIRDQYAVKRITIAAMDPAYFHNGYDTFVFQKNKVSSQAFLDLVDDTDLVVCVDSGPLHIATALKKHTIAYFGITTPEIVLNSGSFVLVRYFDILDGLNG